MRLCTCGCETSGHVLDGLGYPPHYGRCKAHRGCTEFTPAEPPSPVLVGPDERQVLADHLPQVGEAVSEFIDELADQVLTAVLAPDGNGTYAVQEERDPPLPVGGGKPLKRATRKPKRGHASAPPVAAALDLLASYDAWWCKECGSRTFEARQCHAPMEPIRVEIHAREAP